MLRLGGQFWANKVGSFQAEKTPADGLTAPPVQFLHLYVPTLYASTLTCRPSRADRERRKKNN
jgi:hypothetical protein